MATLTWRNVDAPDFRPAMEGVRNATTLLSNAFDRAGGMVDQFTQARSDAADRAVMQRMLGLQDPKAYKAALADGSLLGPQADSVSTGTLANLDSRVGSLWDRAIRQNQVDQGTFNLGRDRYAQNRLESGNVAMDAAGPIIQQAQILQRQGREDEATRLLSTIQGLRPDQYAGVLQNVDTTGSNALSRGQTIQNMDQSAQRFQNEQWRFGNERTEYGEARAGDALADKIAQRAPDAQTAAQFLDASGASAAVKQRALARLGAMGYKGVYGPIGSGDQPVGGSGGTGGFAGSIPFDETRNYVQNIASRAGDLSGKTNAEKAAALTPLVLQQESGGRRYDANGNLIQGPVTRSGERAQGEMQVMPATSRDPGYGIKPAQNNSPEELARVGRDYLKAMLDKYDGNVEQALAAYNAGPGTVDKWLSRQISQQGNAFGTKQVNQRLAERAAENFAATGTTPEQYLSDLGDTASSRKVAQRLSGEGGEFAGANTNWLENQINRMRDQSKGPDGRVRLSPAQIGRMMIQSSAQADSGMQRLGRWIAGPRGSGDYGDSGATLFGGSPNLGERRLNDRELAERMRQYLSGQTGTNIEATQSLGNVAQVVNQAQAAYDEANTQLSRLRAAGQGRPGYQASIRLAETERDAALQTLRQAQSGVPANSGLVPTRDRTTPVPVDRPAGVSENATRGPLGRWWVSRTDDQETRR